MRDGGVQVVHNGPERLVKAARGKNGCLVQKGISRDKVNGHDAEASKNLEPTKAATKDVAQAVEDLDLDGDLDEKSDASSSNDSFASLPKKEIIQNQERTIKACRKLQRVRSIPMQMNPRAYQVLHGPIHIDNRKRKLIIHLDIRNTILVADSITNVSVEEALNSFLTSVTWGSEENSQWTWFSNIPSLKSPQPGLKTYYKYLEAKLVKNPQDRVNLRLQTGDFAHTSLGRIFQKDFKIHLARLAWQFDTCTSRDKVLTMSGRDGTPYHYILPGVYKLLHHLTAMRRDFAVVIRTYGRDGPNVMSSLNYGLLGNHPAFKTPLRLKVHKTPGIIKRKGSNSFELQTYKARDGTGSGNCSEIHQLLTHERDMYRMMCATQGISGYVDDFYHWQGNGYIHTAGKPLWLDTSDTRHHHIFFDDNFRADDEDSIVDVRVFNKDNGHEARSLGLSEVALLENACLVQADLLESIADEDYFLRMVRECEQKYTHLLWSNQL
ncbi:hypothetical protein PoB_002394100 [Plakobranchus ocellatus]|uniref:Uncharacterized protein n=1 Tax=Plakobranchus ocellatus TaxID=259542 RepID=A0AAV3ZSG4_9GAST|nr:hypothetical protein PoB_002394100 [Plakobranchus ocellatus]